MARFLQGQFAFWYEQPIRIDAVLTDRVTGLPYYHISDPAGELFCPRGYEYVGEYQLQPAWCAGCGTEMNLRYSGRYHALLCTVCCAIDWEVF